MKYNELSMKDFEAIFNVCMFDDLAEIKKPTTIEPEKNNYPIRNCPKGYEFFNEDWCLSQTGDMFNRRSGYDIWDYMLKHKDLVLHLMEKVWFDANTFIPAYFESCKRQNIKYVQIQTFYK